MRDSLHIHGDGRLDLRSGRSIWEHTAGPATPSFTPDSRLQADVAIVGAGITGAFLAERLSRAGRTVLVVDRNEPQSGSTAASTALLQWEIDAPMLELEERLGFETAAQVYQRSIQTVRAIGALASGLRIGRDFAWRDTLYLAGNELDMSDLREEHRLRQLAGIDGTVLTGAELEHRFGFERDGALHYGGSAEVHPIELARALLNTAVRRGARVASPAHVVAYDCSVTGVRLATSEGVDIECELLVLANGYEMPAFVPARSHRVVSTWAVATKPQRPEAIWPDRCLVWEASDPYAYLRTTPDNGIVIGGEDEALTDARRRDTLLPAKTAALQRKLSELRPDAALDVAAAWTGFFGETEDGLPLIGPVPGQARCYAAFGYGGNGITFSALAAEMIGFWIEGGRDPLEEVFAVDR